MKKKNYVLKRKCIQYKEKEEIKAVKKNIKKRDFLQKLAGFYKIYPNTIKIDVTECKSVEESTNKVLEILTYILIPISFIVFSIILWNVK